MNKTDQIPLISADEFISKALSTYVENKLAFALWRLPDSGVMHLAASERPQEWSSVNLEEAPPGFLFSPFDPAGNKIFLPNDEYHTFESGRRVSSKGSHLEDFQPDLASESGQFRNITFPASMQQTLRPTDESTFETLVTLCREEITGGHFEKLVPTRCKLISLPGAFDLWKAYQRLCALHPHAMVSVFSSQLTGTWMGATPELLVSVDREQHFRTVAIAGTQPATEINLRDVTWTQKDIEEQALVERYIISCFKKIRVREFEEHGPKTVVAGNVLHLKTDFDVDMAAINFPQLGSVMLKLLHPTSAVCGMPMEASLEFLKRREGYDRQFYSGYLGPVSIGQESHLYVNLRCLQLFPGKALLYAGAGVLADSDPEKEWRETEMKMNMLEQIVSK